MRKAKKELLQFLAGLAMLVAGLFILSQKVMVYSGFFDYGWRIGGFHMGNGLVMVPFIIGIVWMFATEGSFPSKIFTAAGVFLIVAAIIMTTNISLVHMTLYEWIVILVLIFGGAGLLARVLFASGGEEKRERSIQERRLDETDRKARAIEEELERIRKEQ